MGDPARHGRARPLPRVDPAVHRGAQARLRRVRRPPARRRRRRHPGPADRLIPDEKEGKVLKVKFIRKEGKDNFDPAYLFDEGSTIEWTPCGKKLTCSYPGIKFAYGPDEFLGNNVTGFFQTLASLKIREFYEKLSGIEVQVD